MATRIEIDYDRQFTNADMQEIIGRTAATLNVLQQLGATFQNLPGIALAAYQTEADALEADLDALNNLIDQIRTLLVSIDAKAGPLDEKNKSALRTLSGLLHNSADKSLLAQITGPTAQSSRPAPATP